MIVYVKMFLFDFLMMGSFINVVTQRRGGGKAFCDNRAQGLGQKSVTKGRGGGGGKNCPNLRDVL